MRKTKWYKQKKVLLSFFVVVSAALGAPALAPTLAELTCGIVTCL